jgi:valyl-tRNA synthetase
MIDERLLKPYNPAETEDSIYKKWIDSGLFNPDTCVSKGFTKPDAPTFSIMLPPPNVTGVLHMGHAATLTIEDIMVRYHRMKGDRTLWLPGTDHAAIATQSKVEKIVEKEEGKRRHDLGREELLKRIATFVEGSRTTIVHQSKKMGASLDWSREAFTLDEERNLAVRTAFKKMYDDGLIYRKFRVVNWDPKGQTTISDDEIIYEAAKSPQYTFKYSKDFPIAIATTRPETKVGDVAVAVHPDDARYKKYVGNTYDIVFAGVPISVKIIADSAVDPAYGTGAVGVTPAHSMVDWEIANRHNLPIIPVINEFAKMTVAAPELKDKKVTEARQIIVEWLKKENLLIKEEIIENNISKAERTNGTIEPLPKLQWFIAVEKKFKMGASNMAGIKTGQEVTLKELMLSVVKENSITFLPDNFTKIYTNWIDKLHDWCISRQIWYGHRIPVWYKGDTVYCGVDAPKEEGYIQDEDTLDTWFSSGLWTFSTLGWPKETLDFKTFHPTNVLETGKDILFFWVARMILMTTYLIGTVPFKTVYLHGTVRTDKGEKMSKSLGNAMDPLDMNAKYGTDATRISLIIGNGPGNDFRISEDKIRGYKNFANKIWNATRFVISSTEDFDRSKQPKLTADDAKIHEEFNIFIKDVTKDIEEYRFYIAGEKLYHYFWHNFADITIERTKEIIFHGTPAEKESAQWLLLSLLFTQLKLLHPFMPFVTEELWGVLGNKKLLMIESWPKESTL